jgi:hypothetical protein
MPMERERYPANWRLIALGIKQAAAWNCQECGRPCRKSGEAVAELEKRLGEPWISELSEAKEKLDEPWLFELAEFVRIAGWEEETCYRAQRFLLTVAHLDQEPGNNKPENLKALCAPCHLRYDRQFWTHNQMARLEREGQLNLLTGAGGGF